MWLRDLSKLMHIMIKFSLTSTVARPNPNPIGWSIMIWLSNSSVLQTFGYRTQNPTKLGTKSYTDLYIIFFSYPKWPSFLLSEIWTKMFGFQMLFSVWNLNFRLSRIRMFAFLHYCILILMLFRPNFILVLTPCLNYVKIKRTSTSAGFQNII